LAIVIFKTLVRVVAKLLLVLLQLLLGVVLLGEVLADEAVVHLLDGVLVVGGLERLLCLLVLVQLLRRL
jgi:hypothetical protein